MELIQLEAFDRAAREGSFTRAAETLGLTQPAVSLRIRTLENEVGGALFVRAGHTLKLTLLGERFLPYARRILTMLQDGVQILRDHQAGRLGEVRIAAPTPFLLSFLVDTLSNFRQRHPMIDILIRERDKKTILQMLYDRMVTLGLVNGPIYDGYFQQIVRFRDPIRAVVASSHPLASHERLTMTDIYQHTIFRVSMFPAMTAFINAVVEHGREGSGGAVISVPMVMARRMVQDGHGVTFLPQTYIQASVESGELHLLDIDDMEPLLSEPVLITPKDQMLDDVHQQFIETLTSTFPALVVS
jgi:DNA-binding transcriptional LysR family regulator